MDPKTGRMMVVVQKLMVVANMYKPGEGQVRLEATRQTQRDIEQAVEQTWHQAQGKMLKKTHQ
jgi:hypothetical protein